MLPLFDMMLQAQNGNGLQEMSKHFGLAQEQATKAMAALMPAFSTGLKRTASNPYDFSQLMGQMATGKFAGYFEDLGKAFTPQGIDDGNSVLGRIFGNKDVSRAIAQQAAQLTGVGQDILKQMMPAMATAMMDGLMKQGFGAFSGQMTNPMANMMGGQFPGQDFWSNLPQAPMIEQWMEAAGFKHKPKAPEMSLFDNPFTQSFQQFFGQAAAAKPSEPAANPFAGNPFVDLFSAMMGTKPPAAEQGQKPESTPPENKAPDNKAGDTAPEKPAMNDVINAMFDSGLEVQKTYQKNVESIFETYLGSIQPKTS